jgi:WD40 repeat protein
VQTAAFSGGGQLIATASNDGETRVWDAATGDLLTSLSGSAASFGGDAYLFTLGSGSTGRLYTCGPCGPIATLIERARRYNTRHFTREQLDGYLGG